MSTESNPLPAGIFLISLVLFLNGVMSIFGGAAILSGNLFGAFLGSAMVSFLTLVFGVGEMVLGYGIYKMRRWAFWISVVLLSVNLISQAAVLIVSSQKFQLLDAAIGVVVLVYLIYLRESFI